jgi:hypothetical protein
MFIFPSVRHFSKFFSENLHFQIDHDEPLGIYDSSGYIGGEYEDNNSLLRCSVV